MKIVNPIDLPVPEITAQMNESRPLPLGRQEFEEWSDRIISGAMIPLGPGEDAQDLRDSQKFALADMLMRLDSRESFKPDIYFIHGLRRIVIQQVAQTIGPEYKTLVKERMAAREAAEKAAREAEDDGA